LLIILPKKMKQHKRRIEIVVLSDVHLGTRGCRAKELLSYLKSIQPEILILNGDIIDVWQFNKRYWPNSHMKVIKHILSLVSKRTKVYYITGNHDEVFRKFTGTRMGSLQIVNDLVLDLNGQKVWFFHGDVFDVIMQHSKWLAKAGAIGYDSLIAINTIVNSISRFFGKGQVSLSKKIKENVKTAIKYIQNFEETAADLAIRKGYHTIACGHIHHPEIRQINRNTGIVNYMNSGDWIENLTALEYNENQWNLYIHREEAQSNTLPSLTDPESIPADDLKNKELFQIMLKEFQS